MADKQLEIVVKLKDMLTGSLNALQGNIAAFGTRLTNTFNATRSAVFSLQGALVALGGGVTAREFIQSAAGIEDFRAQLQALVGDGERANAVLVRMREFALQTPVSTNSLINAFTELRIAGVANAEEITQRLAQISDDYNLQFEQLADGFRTMQTRQLRAFGIELEKAGNLATFKFMEAGQQVSVVTRNTAEDIQRTLLDVLNRKFPEAGANAADTFNDVMQRFRNSMQGLMADVGTVFLPTLKRIFSAMTDFINQNRDQIVAAFMTFPEIMRTIGEHIREQFEGAFGTGKIGEGLARSFLAITQSILKLFVDMIVGFGTITAEAAKQLWKPLLVEFVRFTQDALVAVARLYDKTAGFLPQIFAKEKTADILRKTFDENFPLFAKALEINFDKAFEAIGKQGEDVLKVLQKDLEQIGAEAGRVGNRMDLSGLQEKIADIIERAKTGIQDAREQAMLLKEAAETASGQKKQPDFVKGWTEGIERVRTDWSDWLIQGRELATGMAHAVRGTFEDMFTRIIQGTFKARDAFVAFGNAVLQVIARMLAEKAAAALIGGFMSGAGAIFGSGGFLGGLGGLFGKGAGAAAGAGAVGGGFVPSGLPMAARGAVWPAMTSHRPVKAYSQGGVADTPQVGIFGEEGAEAFVPLPDGRRIPVNLMGQRGNVTIVNLGLTVQAWDAQDVWRNRKMIMNAVRDDIENRGLLRETIRSA